MRPTWVHNESPPEIKEGRMQGGHKKIHHTVPRNFTNKISFSVRIIENLYRVFRQSVLEVEHSILLPL